MRVAGRPPDSWRCCLDIGSGSFQPKPEFRPSGSRIGVSRVTSELHSPQQLSLLMLMYFIELEVKVMFRMPIESSGVPLRGQRLCYDCKDSATNLGPVETIGNGMDQISIYSDLCRPETLLTLLETEIPENSTIHLEVKRSRSLETTVLVALVGVVGTGLGALITGLLKVAEKKSANRVVVQGRSGRRLEIPAGVPRETISEYVRLAKELDIDRIEL